MMVTEPAVVVPARDTPTLEAARMYLDLGLLPIPVYGVDEKGACLCGNRDCKARGKHPVGANWQKRAPRTSDEVRDIFDGHYGNLGVCVAGTPYVVLDFDGEEGLATLTELEDAGMIPRTLRARSGGGGAHLIYELDTRHGPAAISDRRVGPKWDVKKHGQVLAAPSRHASGAWYEWIDPAPIARLTDPLFDRIRRPHIVQTPYTIVSGSDLVARARAYVATMPPAIAGSGGHNATFAVARKLVQDFALPEHEAWAILVEYNLSSCQPAWTERELRHKFESAKSAHTRRPIQDRPRLVHSVPTTPAPLPQEPDWKHNLMHRPSKRGDVLVNHVDNVIRILHLHPEWSGRVRYDEFRGRVVVTDPPWDKYQRPREAETQWTDEDATRLQAWLVREFYGFTPTITDCERAVDVVARVNGWHPVRDYLEGLVHDGTRRLSNGAARYFGAEASEYASNVFRWWMISAVARVMTPGCKADHVLILEGKQGRGKSTALEVLAGDWFSDSAIDLNSKDAFERIRGRWIVELAELDALFRVESSRAKQFFSSKRDDYRPAYARREREQRRACVFAGTVNEGVYLKDPTGARRFWPIVCARLDLEALRRDRDQLWAEALWWFREGARWWPEGDDETAPLEEEQASRTERDEWIEAIRRYLGKIPPNASVTTGELLESALTLEKRDWTRANQTRVGTIMSHALKWQRRRERHEGDLRWAYVRSEAKGSVL